MWKRVLVAIIALVGTFSVAYAFNGDMFATAEYKAGGNVTGRVNKEPSNLSVTGNNIGLREYDTLQMNTFNSYAKKPLAWKLIEKHTYTDYWAGSCTPTESVVCNNPEITAWYSLSNDPIGNMNPGGKIEDFVPDILYGYYMYYNKTALYSSMTAFNALLSQNAADKNYLTYRDLTKMHALCATLFASNYPNLARANSIASTLNVKEETQNNAFTPEIPTADIGYAFGAPYLSNGAYHNGANTIYVNNVIGADGLRLLNEEGNTPPNTQLLSSGFKADLRPGAYLSADAVNNIVFALSNGTTTGFASIDESGSAPMQPRAYDSNLTISFDGIYKDTQGDALLDNKISANTSVYLKGTVNNAGLRDGTVALLVFSKEGKFSYYKPLGGYASLSNYFKMDTTGLPVGNYQIALVNETYGEVTGETSSSLISDVKNIEIVNPLSNVTVTNTPQAGASSVNTYEYSKNVSQGIQVASISTTGGSTSNFTYELVADSLKPDNQFDFRKFEIKQDESGNKVIVVKEELGLNAGDYYFKVKVNDLSASVESSVHIYVEKTSATVNLKDGTQIANNVQKDIIANGSSFTGSIETNNTDLNGGISTSKKPEYALVSANTSNTLSMGSIADIDKYVLNTVSNPTDTSKLPDVYTLSVKIPETDNYKESNQVSRSFRVYKELNTPGLNGNGSGANKTIFTTMQVVPNFSLGTLTAKDGIKDANSKYTIALTTEADGENYDALKAEHNSKVNILEDTKEVVLKEKLLKGTYAFQFKVSDAIGKTIYFDVSITVQLVNQDTFSFTKTNGGLAIDKITESYGKNNIGEYKIFQLYTSGGTGNGAITYKTASGQPTNIISVDTTTGVVTIKNASEQPVQVIATKAGGIDYADKETTIDITILKGTQTVKFKENTPTHKQISDGDFNVVAEVKDRLDGSVSTAIKYSSQDESICTVGEVSGNVTPKTKVKATCTITAVNEEANYVRMEESIDIKLYEDLDSKFNQTTKPVTVGTGTVKIADITTTGGDGTYTYAFNPLTSLLTIGQTDGMIKLKKTLETSDLIGKWDANAGKYMLHEKVTVSDASGNQTIVNVDIECTGTTLNASFNGATNKILHVPFTSVGDSFKLALKDNLGNGDVTYSIVSEDTTGDIFSSLTGSGQTAGEAFINRASKGDSDYAVVKAVITPKDGYMGQELTLKIYIDKATQSMKFDPVLPSTKKFVESTTFKATAKADVEGTTITYTTSPSEVCTNTGDTITMKSAGDCIITASGVLANYNNVTTPATIIKFFNGVDAVFTQENNNLQAQIDTESIDPNEVQVGKIETTGGLHTTSYNISDSESDDNKASSLFLVSGTGAAVSVSLKQNIKASDLNMLGVYDEVNDTYLLKFQVNVFDGPASDTVDTTVNCVVRMKGATLSSTFTSAVNKVITKTYDPNQNFFDLSIEGNLGEGSITYALKSESGMPTDIISLVGSRVTILNADEKSPTITADIKASKGYEKKQIEVSVNVKKATLLNFQFKTTDKEDMLKGSSIKPLFNGELSGADIELSSSDLTKIEINGDSIVAKDIGEATITAKTPLSTDTKHCRNYEQKSVSKVYGVYDSLMGEIKQTNSSMRAEDEETSGADTLVGMFSYENGNGDIEVKITQGDEFFYLTQSNKIYLEKSIQGSDLVWDEEAKAYVIPLTITLTDKSGDVEITKKITFLGVALPTLSFKDAKDGKISTPYVLNGRYALALEGYKDGLGNALYGALSFQLKNDPTMPSDVVNDVAKINDEYKVFMGQANDPKDNANPVIVEAVVQPGNGYEGGVIECIFEITKADQDFDFVAGDISFKKGTSFTPKFTAKPKGNNGVVLLSNPDNEKNIIQVVGTSLSGIDVGISTISATATGTRNYNDKVVTKSATVYDSANLTFTQNETLPQAETQSGKTGSSVGNYKVAGGLAPITVSLDDTLVDNAYFELQNDEIISIKKDMNASDLANKPWNEEKQAYEMKLTFTISDNVNNKITQTETVFVKGAPIHNVSFKDSDGNATTKISKSYAKEGTFTLELTGKVNNTWPYGTVTYGMKEGTNTTDVLSKIEANGLVTIQNANLLDNPEKVMGVATIAPGQGYDAKIVETEIFIEKAKQPDFRFRNNLIIVEKSAPFEPEYDNLLSTGEVDISFEDASAATYDKEAKTITASKETKVFAMSDINDRNYQVARAEATIKIKDADDYIIQIKVPDPVFYGNDSELSASIEHKGDATPPVEHNWLSSDQAVATIDESGKITIHNAGTTLIHYEEKIDPNSDKFVASLPLKFTIKPKPISVTISSKEKYVGQDVPEFLLEPIVGLVGEDSISEPIYGCQDTNGDDVDAYTGVGNYEIKGYFAGNANPNYKITLANGVLNIKQDPSKASWYEVVSDAQPSGTGWYNKPVTLRLVQEGSYDKISDHIKGPWDETIVVNEEGILDKDVYFKDMITSAIASPQEQIVKVDETAPKITSIAGSEIKTNTVSRFLNMLTFNRFFKPGSEIIITAEDVKPQVGIEVSNIARISYKVYRDVEDEEGNTLVKEASVDADKAVFALEDPDDYKICAIAYDQAGNATKEECQKANVKKIDVDVDGDGPLDFNDSDNNGCPDLNIKWKDTDGNWIIINGDRDYDGIPDLNIDSDGDGKVDINIDTDNDQKPDVNLVILKKSDWLPSTCVTTETEEYCTGTYVKPLINADTDIKNSKIEAELDIDTNGDMIADINISKNGKSAINIAIHKDWEPNKDFAIKGFTYDSDITLKRYLNIDTSGDGFPDVNIDLDDDGIADLNIDTDGNEIPDVDIDGDGDGKQDVNIDDDGDGNADREIMDIPEWKPDNRVDVNEDLSYGTITIKRSEYLEDEGFVMRNGNGTKFLPVYALKVVNITSDKLASLQNYAFEGAEEREPIAVYELSLLRNEETVPLQTDALIQVPIDENIKNPKFYLQHEEKEAFVPIDVKQENGVFTFTTSSLGELAVLGEKQGSEEVRNPKEDIDLNMHIGGASGGSRTGDSTNLWLCISLFIGSGVLMLSLCKYKNVRK